MVRLHAAGGRLFYDWAVRGLFMARGSADALTLLTSSFLFCAQITPIPAEGRTFRRVCEDTINDGVDLAVALSHAFWRSAILQKLKAPC